MLGLMVPSPEPLLVFFGALCPSDRQTAPIQAMASNSKKARWKRLSSVP